MYCVMCVYDEYVVIDEHVFHKRTHSNSVLIAFLRDRDLTFVGNGYDNK